MRIGAKLPNSGSLALKAGVPAMACALENAGYDSLWVSDHIVMPREMRSWYPFAADGKATWPSDLPYLDALIVLAMAAAATKRVRLGTAVLVLGLRPPLEFAKQAATIDAVSGGRLELGVGAGWLAEEFAALNVPFNGRGARMVESMEIARDCWTGETSGRAGAHYTIPEGIQCRPVPAHPIPFLVGGHSNIALRRAGAIGDGWLAQQEAPALDPALLADEVGRVAAAAAAAGRTETRPRVVLRIVQSLDKAELVATRLVELERAGVDEVIVDVPVDEAGATAALATLREGLAWA
jgi:probable F420-dependent oxidoreductase